MEWHFVRRSRLSYVACLVHYTARAHVVLRAVPGMDNIVPLVEYMRDHPDRSPHEDTCREMKAVIVEYFSRAVITPSLYSSVQLTSNVHRASRLRSACIPSALRGTRPFRL